MEHKMRRFKQLLSPKDTKQILFMATNGILSLTDSDGEPYGVPLNYAYDGEDSIFFHCAAAGHKLECIIHDPRCSFCAVSQDLIMPKEFTSYFRSVIVKGKITEVRSLADKTRALMLLCDKYSPGVESSE